MKKTLKIFYGDNGDLYFDIFGCRDKDENGLNTATFSIGKSEELYQYFEQLVNNIINCNVYDVTDIELEFSSSKEISSVQRRNENLKNKRAYKKLVHDDTIIWYSDNIYDEAANILKVEKELEQIKLTFIDNPDDPSFGFGIRICNSSSKYDPFNICFMNLFNRLQLLAKETPIKGLVKTMKK